MMRKIPIRFILSGIFIIAGLWLLTENIRPFFVLFDSGQAEKTTVLAKEPKQETSSNSKSLPKDDTLYPIRPQKGEKIGTLTIPKISSTLPIIHGTNEDELEKGVGHFAGSVLPGEKDNSVLSGHRDTVFRKLGEVGVGDLLIVNTSAGEFTYKVRKVRIVDADDRTVIVPKPRATLTVTTCYPFDYIGDAPQRYILVADLMDTSL